MMQKQEPELYSIGTDICDYYGFKATAVRQQSLDYQTGEIYTVTSNNYWTSENYAEINPKYTYAKKQTRLYRICYYDKNFNYVGQTDSMSNTNDGVVLENIPTNARYVRIAMFYRDESSWNIVGLVRTA